MGTKVPGLDEAKVEKELAFTIDEYKRRLAGLRKRMEERDLDVLVITTPENIYYLSGYHTPGYYCSQCLIVGLDGESIFVTRGTEEMNVKAMSWIDVSDSYMDSDDPIEKFSETLKAAGFQRARIGIEKIGWFFSIADYERLQGLLPEASYLDGSMLVEAGRLIKSEAELAYIRKAAEIASAAMDTAFDVIRPGITEDDVAAEVLRATVSMGGEYPGLPPFVCAGVRTSFSHATWSGKRIEEGEPVSLELPSVVKRYAAALFRCAVAGTPSDKIHHMIETSRRALHAMLGKIRPGVPLGDVWEEWAKTMAEAGYVERYRRTGYSVGINFPPDWGEGYILCFKMGERRLLEPDMTFHIPSIIKIFGFANVGYSETVRVTETGVEVLTSFNDRL